MEVVKNAKRNMLFGVINRLALLLCPFVKRTIIRYVLGVQYLGIGNLFASVLQVLSLSELGLSSAIVYNLYKPVAEGDTNTVNAYLCFFKKAYRVIGIVVLSLGLLLIPFLPKLIKGSYPSDINIYLLYLIYLLDSSVSYFLFAYLSPILTVHQRDDINSKCNTVVTFALTATQIGFLYLTKNYVLFCTLMPIFTVISNLWVSFRIRRAFPQYCPAGKISKDDLEEIKKLVAGTFIQKACNVTRNSLDSICISAFLGLSLTAIYNNYFYISNSITIILLVFDSAFIGGVGNHIVSKTKEENFNELKNIDFIYLCLSGWCTICLVCLYQPFMEMWMGKELLLPFPAVILLCVYFYVLKLGDMRSIYSSACGIWWEQRYKAFSETILNLILNIVLGKHYGIYGIILATLLSLIVCNCFWSTAIFFRLYFSMSKIKAYYSYQMKLSAVTVLIGITTYALCTLIHLKSIIFTILVRGMICVFFSVPMYVLLFRKTEEFKYALAKIKLRKTPTI